MIKGPFEISKPTKKKWYEQRYSYHLSHPHSALCIHHLQQSVQTMDCRASARLLKTPNQNDIQRLSVDSLLSASIITVIYPSYQWATVFKIFIQSLNPLVSHGFTCCRLHLMPDKALNNEHRNTFNIMSLSFATLYGYVYVFRMMFRMKLGIQLCRKC